MPDDMFAIEGLKEVDKMLADMGSALGFKALRTGMMNAAKPTFLLARANAIATGLGNTDSDAMGAAMSRGTRKITPTRTTHWIGPRNKSKKALAIYNAFHSGRPPVKRLNYFHMVEWGSIHGQAQPFMRPAFAATAPTVVRNLAKEIGIAIDKVIRKHNAKRPV